MNNIKKIMVAYDFSQNSIEALKYASDLARALNSQITMVNVINQRDVDAIQWLEYKSEDITVDSYLEAQKKERGDRMDKVLDELALKSFDIKKAFKVGIPFLALSEAVEELTPDLLIIGSKGRSNLPNVNFGTTAEKLLRRCTVPILVIR